MDEVFSSPWMLFLALSLMGWFTILFGLRLRRDQKRQIADQHMHADGTVVDYVPPENAHPQGKAGRALYPVVAFQVYEQACRLQCPHQLDRAQFPIGQAVDVYYDPGDPQRFHLGRGEEFLKGSRLALRIGILWVALCAALVLGLHLLSGGSLPSLRRSLRGAGIFRPSGGSIATAAPQATGSSFQVTPQGGAFALLSGYSGQERELKLPIAEGSYVINGMSSSALAGSRTIVSVTVPGLYQVIPTGAFAGCVRLTTVTLENGITAIDRIAFSMCPALAEVTLPESVQRIGEDAFAQDCQALFHVKAGSVAEQYCRQRGYRTQADIP